MFSDIEEQWVFFNIQFGLILFTQLGLVTNRAFSISKSLCAVDNDSISSDQFEVRNFIKFIDVESPLDQFEVINLLSFDAPILGDIYLSLTNIGLYLMIGVLNVLILNVLATNYDKIVSNEWSVSKESLYDTIYSIVVNQINGGKGQIYFPFIYSLFVFILVNNLIGMVKIMCLYTNKFLFICQAQRVSFFFI